MQKLYFYGQNNTGGKWNYLSKKLNLTNLIVIAESDYQANLIAESYGVYFGGCTDYTDCPCCGDRWNRSEGTTVTSINDIYLSYSGKALIVDRPKDS